ncbi:MAG: hypothetical protein ACR2NY_06550 [Alphaproteobacteria bacterium]
MGYFFKQSFFYTKLLRSYRITYIFISLVIGNTTSHLAKAEWLFQANAEFYIPTATTINQDGKTAKISNDQGGGFSAIWGYRFLQHIDTTLEYVFLHHHSHIKSGGLFNHLPVKNFYVSHHLALANIGYHFGRYAGLKNFGIDIGTGFGAEITNGGVGLYHASQFVMPFKLAVNYQINEIFTMGIYSRYYFPIGDNGTANAKPASIASVGAFSAGLSLGLNF